MNRIQGLLVPFDSYVHHFCCLVDDVSVAATPVEDNIVSLLPALLVGGLRDGQRSQHRHLSIQLLDMYVQKGKILHF